MKYEAVNVVALDNAVEILFGAQMVPTVHRTYQVIDRSMNAAYAAGVASVAPPPPQHSAVETPLIEKDPNVVKLNSTRLDTASLAESIDDYNGTSAYPDEN